MTHRAQLAILALLIVLLLVWILFPRQAASDAPVVAAVVPASEFEAITGNRKAPLSQGPAVAGFTSIPVPPLVTDYAGAQGQSSRMIDAPSSQTLPVVGSPPILEEPAPSPSAPRPVSVAPVSRHPVGRQSASSGETPATGPTASSVAGQASWFRSPRGVSAAGPALRRALGPSWRGSRVQVCGISTCITVILGDWCACSGRVIDLDSRSFSRLAPLSRGVVEVSVRW